MGRELAFTVWKDGTEYLQGSSPEGVELPDHVWVESSDSAPAPVGTVSPEGQGRTDVARLVELAERAYENADDPAGRWLAAVTAVLTDLGIDVSQRSLTDEAQPRVEEEVPSQFETVPVTEGGEFLDADARDSAATPGAEVESESVEGVESPVTVDEPAPAATPEPVKAPARSGRGSSLTDWQAFAEANNVDVHAEAERHEVIEACEQAGLIPAK